MPTPGHQTTADDVGPAVNVISWFLASTAFLTVLLRALTKGMMTRLGIDDLFILFALILSLAISVTNGLQVNNGLGRHISTLSEAQLVGYQKATYASDVLHVLVLLLSKVSVLFFFQMLSPVLMHQRMIKHLLKIIIFWGMASFLVTVFQCRAPQVWGILDTDRCINRIAFMDFFNATNIVLEAVLVAFPVGVVLKIQTNLSKKLLLVTCFAARVLVIGALIAEIATGAGLNGSSDRTFDGWPTAIAKQLVNSLSVITACIPYYVAWVPNAFRIYANLYANGGAARRPPRRAHTVNVNLAGWASNGETHITSQIAEEDRHPDTSSEGSNPMCIRKTMGWDIKVDALDARS